MIAQRAESERVTPGAGSLPKPFWSGVIAMAVSAAWDRSDMSSYDGFGRRESGHAPKGQAANTSATEASSGPLEAAVQTYIGG